MSVDQLGLMRNIRSEMLRNTGESSEGATNLQKGAKRLRKERQKGTKGSPKEPPAEND